MKTRMMWRGFAGIADLNYVNKRFALVIGYCRIENDAALDLQLGGIDDSAE